MARTIANTKQLLYYGLEQYCRISCVYRIKYGFATSNTITWCLNDESNTDKVSCMIFFAYVVSTIKYEVLWINFIPQIYFSFFTFMIIWMKGARACTHIYAEKTATNIICFSYFTKVVRASNIYSVGTAILHKLFKDTQ